ncbi:MAG: CBS domain-containing protein [Desulfovibrionaceae bacterium]|nr:CBS domain-containing protein [Desulfovibrionaceae bacterium]
MGAKMTAPAKVVRENDSLASAEAMMLRYGLKAAPVVGAEGMYCLGLLDYQTAARAVSHKLGPQKVADYMYYGAKTLTPSSSLYPAINIILSQRQRMVPVVDDDGCVLGVLTRTDIMRLLIDESIHLAVDGSPSARKERNLRNQMKEKLPQDYFDFLSRVGRLADRLKTPVYIVGGFVRDLLLDRVNLDMDLTVEGDGMAFGRSLAEELRGSMREHKKFQTVMVLYNDDEGRKRHIDVATARLEYYEHPGALPTVELSSIKMDLSRRDFTINALAIRLNSNYFGDLVDPFGAQRDMKEKSIRVLHSLSFVEDPTRVLRAVRFEKRFGFRMDQQSEKLIKSCLQLGFLRNLSGSRLFNELKHIFNEKNPLPCLERMDSMGVLAEVHPLLKLNPAKVELLSATGEVLFWYRLLYLNEEPENWVVYLLGLCPNAKYPEMSDILARFNFSEKARSDFLQLREATRKVGKELAQWQKNTERNIRDLYTILVDLPLEGILHIMAESSYQDIKKELSFFLSRLRNMRLEVTGQDMLDLGAESGPGIGLVLRMIREARAGGEAESREEQLALGKLLLERHQLICAEQQAIEETVAGRT